MVSENQRLPYPGCSRNTLRHGVLFVVRWLASTADAGKCQRDYPGHLRAVRVFSVGRLFERSLHPQVTQYILSRQEQDPVLTKLLQKWGGDASSTVCDGCSQQLDSGSWWKCKQCDDVNLCQECYKTDRGLHHIPSHSFTKWGVNGESPQKKPH